MAKDNNSGWESFFFVILMAVFGVLKWIWGLLVHAWTAIGGLFVDAWEFISPYLPSVGRFILLLVVLYIGAMILVAMADIIETIIRKREASKRMVEEQSYLAELEAKRAEERRLYAESPEGQTESQVNRLNAAKLTIDRKAVIIVKELNDFEREYSNHYGKVQKLSPEKRNVLIPGFRRYVKEILRLTIYKTELVSMSGQLKGEIGFQSIILQDIRFWKRKGYLDAEKADIELLLTQADDLLKGQYNIDVLPDDFDPLEWLKMYEEEKPTQEQAWAEFERSLPPGVLDLNKPISLVLREVR